MGIAHHEVARRWAEQAISGPESRSMRGTKVFANVDEIYSYGYHFEMGRIVRDKRNERPLFFLLNGDRYSNSTTGHQGDVRGAVASVVQQTGLPVIIVPFSALEAAGIAKDSIEPINVRGDRNVANHHSIPADFPLPSMHPFERGQEGQVRGEEGERRPHGVKFSVTRYTNKYDYDLHEYAACDETNHYINGHGAKQTADGERWEWETHTHFLGDSLFRARLDERRVRPATPEEIDLYERGMRWQEARAMARQAWLQTGGLDRHDTFEDSPAAAALEREFGGVPEPSGVSGRYTRGETIYEVEQHVRRSAYYLSSFDYQERDPLYFLCELPRGAKPRTVEHAVEALQPSLVRTAIAGGVEVTRQGDIFGIPTELTTAQVKRLTPRGKGRIVKRAAVLGTNHEPSEVMFATGDRVYARGFLYHNPGEFRPSDHARRRLGDGRTWHLLMRNTVPRTRTASRRERTTA